MTQQGYQGAADANSGQGDYNSTVFVVEQVLSRVNTATLVKIVSVTNSGGLSPVGFVDVQPLVNQVDGADNATFHGVVHSLPYCRIQGGGNAIILDPQPGDIGIAIFADHDLSNINATKAQANPGSGRRFSMSDGLYIGGVLNGVPSQYVQFNASGITIVTPNNVVVHAGGNVTATASGSLTATAGTTATITAPSGLTINANVQLNGTLTTTGMITAPNISIT